MRPRHVCSDSFKSLVQYIAGLNIVCLSLDRMAFQFDLIVIDMSQCKSLKILIRSLNNRHPLWLKAANQLIQIRSYISFEIWSMGRR